MFRRPATWIAFTLLAILGIAFSIKYFSQAYPIVSINITMDRESALRSARESAEKYSWGPEGYRQAASFVLDRDVQNFVELEVGGTKAFSTLLKQGRYAPYTWHIRHFKENETTETLVRFTQEGQPYGFAIKLPEDQPGSSIPGDSARSIAELAARSMWDIDLSAYVLVEQSQEVHTGGRTDHTIVYERREEQLGEGRYRLRLMVGGDQVTELTHFIKIPEAFSRRYEEMRSANNTISTVSIFAIAIFYILGGCVIGLFFLIRQRWVIWKKPLFWGLFVSFLQVLAMINRMPLVWMDYDTALSSQGFMLQQIAQIIVTFLGLGLLLTLSFMAAESLTRKAFPNHLQFWRLWSSDVASSKAVLGRTAGGYLAVALFFAFDIALYFFASKVLGWWTPSEALFEPDVIATYFPWLTSIAISLQAGFMEECLFRAIPIAGAALIGQRLGNRNAWIVGAFILQALIFGSGHANYPQQPAYARVVELIIPSIVFGLIYLYFGLLTAIISHFVIDVIWFAIPLFASSSPGIWASQAWVIVLTLVPLWVIVWSRWRKKSWLPLKPEHFNYSWQPPAVEFTEPEVTEVIVKETSGLRPRLLMIAGLIGLIIWTITTEFKNMAPSLPYGRGKAEELAGNALAKSNFQVKDSWKLLSEVISPMNQDDRFVWQNGGEENYLKLLGTYLSPPLWKVRALTFEGDVAERAEEFQVYLNQAGHVFRLHHLLPEGREGMSLTVEEARASAYSAIHAHYSLDSTMLKVVSAEPFKLPNRTDWLFTFADTSNYPLNKGEARIAVRITGDQIADIHRSIFIPEDWERQERNRENTRQILRIFCNLFIFGIMAAGIIVAIVNWGRKKFSVSVFLTSFIFLFILGILNFINDWPSIVAVFSTAEPYENQAFIFIIIRFLGALFLSAGIAMLLGFIQSWKRTQKLKSFIAGIGTGAILAGAISLISYLFEPSLQPLWAEYDALSAFVPFASAALSPLMSFILRTALYLLLIVGIDRFTSGWTVKKTGMALIFLIIVLLSYGSSMDDISYWLISGFFSGVILLLAYLFVFRHQIALVPVAIATWVSLDALQQGLFRTFPGALAGAIFAIFLIGSISFLWYKKLCD